MKKMLSSVRDVTIPIPIPQYRIGIVTSLSSVDVQISVEKYQEVQKST
jgi:hypothetical protein